MPITKEGRTLLTFTEAAQKLGLPVDAVKHQVYRSKRLSVAGRVGTTPLLNQDDVMAYQHRKAGRPKPAK